MSPVCPSPELAICRKSFRRRGFTLMETLVIISVFAVMLTLVVPAVSGMKRGQALGQQVESLSSFLEQARVMAVGRNTFVWVGFHEKKESGTPVVIVNAVVGRSGQASDLANSKFQQAMKPLYLRNAMLDAKAYESLPGFSVVNNQDVSQSPLSFRQSVGTDANVQFGSVIVFSPAGGARISQTALSRLIGIGLAAGPVKNNTDVAAVQISGLNGNISIYRK